MGCRLLAARRLPDAKAALLRSVELNPKLAKSHAALGDALIELGDKEGGVASYKAALDLEPNDWLLCFSYGNLLQDIGRDRDAVSAFERALKLAKDPIDRELIQEELQKTRRPIRR